MENSGRNEPIVCSYNSRHQILRSSLSTHLIRCSNNHEDMEMVYCPFNTTHLVKEDELQAHILCCKSGERQRIKLLGVPESKMPLRPILEVTDDSEDQHPIPDPDKLCKNNLIVYSLQGESPEVRRKFRESERMRFELIASNNKFDPPKETTFGN